MHFKPDKIQFAIDRFAPLEKAEFAVIPVPWEKTTSYGKGAKKGPAAIIKASYQLELWDEEIGTETWKRGIVVLGPVNCNLPEKDFFANLEHFTEVLIEKTKAIPVFLGGEHSITQGIMVPFRKKHRNLSILHFDAHADLRPEYEGNPRSHASAMYPPSRKSKTVQVGIRNVAPEEKDLINSGKVITYLMHENLNINSLIKKIIKNLTDTVYLTIDVDGFDPSVMPATGTPQPGGFAWYDALKLFKAVCRKKKVVGIDVVETSPRKIDNITEFNAAKLVYRLMGYL